MEDKVNDRVNALLSYYKGQESIANEKVLSAIGYYRQSLHFLREVSQAEITAQDTRDIQDTLSALINALNMLITLFPEAFTGIQVVNELDRFLHLYVGSFNVFKKTEQRLPWLNELNLKKLGDLWRALSLRSEKGRCEIYIAIISLFHEEMTAEKELKIKPDKDAAMDKAFKLYQRALEIAPPSEPDLPLVVVVAPPVVAAPPVRVVKPVLASRMPKFDQFAEPEKKRADIILLMEMKKYEEVVRRSEHIFDRVASDYRQACEAYYEIGNAHCGQGSFQKAIESYKESLLQCKHIMEIDVSQEDQNNIAKVFTALVKALDEMTREWSQNFVEASKSLADILNFYVDYFYDFQNAGKKLPGWDEMDIGNLIPFLSEIGDETQQEITKIYLTVIAMFRQDAKLEEGQLLSLIEELKAKKETHGNDKEMIEVFDVFQKALTLVQSMKQRTLLNPELQTVQREPKRRKEVGDSSSSSSFPPFGLESRVVVARHHRQDPPPGSSQSYLKK